MGLNFKRSSELMVEQPSSTAKTGDHMRSQIRTLLQHERVTGTADKQRGARFWVAAELLSSTFFVVEVCSEYTSTTEVQRWVTTSIREAVRVEDWLTPNKWSRIYMHISAPLTVLDGAVYELLQEAHKVEGSDTYVYKLANGMTVRTNQESSN
jgi:hypothetical protein